MAWLLIDNSNGRTKFALGSVSGLLPWRGVIPTARLEMELPELEIPGEFGGVAIASVVPASGEILRNFFQDRRRVHSIGWKSPLGFGFEMEDASRVGADRLANVAALKRGWGAPGIAVDFGTAVTFSALSEDGNFMGGAIAPGMGVMSGYLGERTALLPVITPVEPLGVIGKTTAEALAAGAVFGQRGMVEGILKRMIAELGGSPVVVATGGGAAMGSKDCTYIHRVDPDLTLEGIRIVAGQVFA